MAALAACALVAAAAALFMQVRESRASSWTVRLADDFEADRLGENWVSNTPEVELRRGRLVMRCGGESILTAQEPLSGDARVELDLSVLPEAPPEAGEFRVHLQLGRDQRGRSPGYVFRLGSALRRGAAVSRNDRELALGAPEVSVMPGSSCRLSVEKAGNRLTLLVDGRTAMAVYDPFAIPVQAAALSAWGGGFAIDNVRMSSRRPPRRAAALEKGDARMAAGDLEGARTEYSACLRGSSAADDGDFAEASIKIAGALLGLGRDAEAVAVMEPLRGSDAWPQAARRLALARAARGDAEGAERPLAELFAGGSRDAVSLAAPAAAEAAMLLARRGSFEPAARLFAMAEMPGLGLAGGAGSLMERACLRRETARPMEALADLSAAVKGFPWEPWEHALARETVGEVFAEMGRFAEARAIFNVVRSDPAVDRWIRGRAAIGAVRALRAEGATAEAAKVAAELSSDESAERCWRAEAGLELAQSLPEEALSRAELARVRSDFSDQAYQAARSLLAEGRLVRVSDARAAAEIFRSVARLYPGHRGLVREAEVELARTLRDGLGDAGGAAEILARAASGEDLPPESSAARDWALAESALGRLLSGEAVSSPRAVEDGGARSRFWQAVMEAEAGRIDAEALLKASSYPARQQALGRFYLGEVKRARGDVKAALEDYRRARELAAGDIFPSADAQWKINALSADSR